MPVEPAVVFTVPDGLRSSSTLASASTRGPNAGAFVCDDDPHGADGGCSCQVARHLARVVGALRRAA